MTQIGAELHPPGVLPAIWLATAGIAGLVLLLSPLAAVYFVLRARREVRDAPHRYSDRLLRTAQTLTGVSLAWNVAVVVALLALV